MLFRSFEICVIPLKKTLGCFFFFFFAVPPGTASVSPMVLGDIWKFQTPNHHSICWGHFHKFILYLKHVETHLAKLPSQFNILAIGQEKCQHVHWKKGRCQVMLPRLGQTTRGRGGQNSEQFLSTQEFFLRINQKKAATSQHNLLNSFKRNS